MLYLWSIRIYFIINIMAKRLTNKEKYIKKLRVPLVRWEHNDIVSYLLELYNNKKDELLLMAASDETNRREIELQLSCEFSGTKNINLRAGVHYNKKRRTFTHISYSDRYNCVIQFSITSKATFFAHEFHQSIKDVFPLFYSVKKLTHYLLTAEPHEQESSHSRKPDIPELNFG